MKRSKARLQESIEFARTQRRTSNEFASTVWQWIRNRQCCQQKFRREVPIPPYTVDFCCLDLKLVIEVDGEPHLSEKSVEYDHKRDQYLRSLGYKILRIHGYEVIQNGSQVIERIADLVQKQLENDSHIPIRAYRSK